MDEEKIKRQWKYLNNLGVYSIEELIAFDKNLILNIGTLGCRSIKQNLMKGDEVNENYTRDIS